MTLSLCSRFEFFSALFKSSSTGPLISVNGEPDHQKLAEVYAKHGMKVVGAPLTAASFA